MSGPALRVVLAQPRGFCAGVERAIEIVERALRRFGPPVYVRHEIVHNQHVVEALKKIHVPVVRWPGGCFGFDQPCETHPTRNRSSSAGALATERRSPVGTIARG